MDGRPTAGITPRIVGWFGTDETDSTAPATKAGGPSYVLATAHGPVGGVAVGEGTAVDSFSGADGSVCILLGDLYVRDAGADGAAEVLAAVLAGGPAATGDIDGEYSAVVWDATRETLWLIRDRNGVHPLFYAEHDGVVLWSADIGGLLEMGVPAVVDPLALDLYLSCGYVFAPLTLFGGIAKVEPAHAVRINGDEIETIRYWTPLWGNGPALTGSDRVSAIGAAFETAVGLRLAQQGPTGVLLSGGIDSSLIVAVACGVHGVPVEAFTFRYDLHDGPMNEGAQARELAEHFGARHREIEISAKWIAENMARLVRAYEEPFTYGLHSSRLGPISDAGVDVLLSGVCTDGWYLSRAETTAFRTARLGRLPLAGLGAVSRAGGRLSPVTRRLATLHRLATAPESAVFYDAAANSILSDAERAEMYRDPTLAADGRRRSLELLDASLDHAPGLSRADRYAYLAWQFDWPEHLLWWNHRWGATSNLSVRYPYVDRRLADLLAASPRPSPPKADFRSYGETLMPTALASRPKYPQAVPMSDWLRGPLQELVRIHLDVRRIEDDGFFDASVVSRLTDEHMSGTADHKWALWTLTSYFVWKDEFGVSARR